MFSHSNSKGRLALLGVSLMMALATPAAFARDHGGYRGGYHGGGYHGGYYGGGYRHGGGGSFLAGALTTAVVGGLIYSATRDEGPQVVYQNAPAYGYGTTYIQPPPTTVIYRDAPTYYAPAPVVRERVIYQQGW
jgi:hypothetical protein